MGRTARGRTRLPDAGGSRSGGAAQAARARRQAQALAARLEGVQAEVAFPELSVAADPRQMVDVFRTHLTPMPGRSYRIEDCTPFRFRYHEHDSHWVLQYSLRVRDLRTRRAWPLWVTGILYADPHETERLWRETAASNPAEEIPPEWLRYEPVGYIPHLRMLIEVFPFDHGMRNLVPAIGGACRHVEPLMLARMGPGQWRTEDRVVEPTGYRTEMGAVLACTLHARDLRSSRSRTARCYLKVYGNERGKATVDLLRTISQRARRHHEPYSVTLPIAYLDEYETLVIEEAQGRPLDQLLLRKRMPVSALRLVAKAVAAFNRDRLPIAKERTLELHLRRIRQAAAYVQWACPEAKDAVRALVREIEQNLDEGPLSPIHGDLKPDHIFLSRGRATFIDLDSAVLGDPVRDPARLYARTVARVGIDKVSEARARAAAEEFVRAYFRIVPNGWRDRFPFQSASAFIEVANEIFKRQDPGWAERMRGAILEGQRVLSGGVA